jgi:hypothetical protein
MAKDYFQDIVPPDNSGAPRSPLRQPASPDSRAALDPADDGGANDIRVRADAGVPARDPEANRGIRNISAPARPAARPGRIDGDMTGGVPPRPRGRSHAWMWAVAIISVIAVAALIFIFMFRSTTVTVTPKSQSIVLTGSPALTAYPAASAATGTLTYTVQASDLEDSDVVQAQGTTTLPAAKASGNITVVNNYSASSVRLIKNTRFETPDGLVFRTPADIVIPGKTAAAPGQVQITVIADQNGEQYNVGPVAHFTLPGLESNAAMYANVYAESTAAMTGGSSGGDTPGIAPAALAAAISDVRARLAAKAQSAANAAPSSDVFTVPALQITYQDLPNTMEAGGGVRIHESAHVVSIAFPATLFAQMVAQSSVSSVADAGTASLTLIPGTGFAVQLATSSTAVLGTDPIDFSLSGNAQIVWSVDAAALAQALAGRDQGAFTTIVNSFAGIEEAHARIEPFWKSSFPANASDIKIVVTAPAAAQ